MSVALEERIEANPAPVATTRLPAADGGIHAEPGFYAWWLTDTQALSSVPTSRHKQFSELGLLYIGIAPSRSSSQETMRSRVLTKHLGNALGSSTLRRGLAAFLWEHNEWHPRMTPGGKVALPESECAELTRWMTTHLRVSWCSVAEP